MTNESDKRQVTGLEDFACPFELARKLQLEIYYYDFPKKIYGLYSPEPSSAKVLINDRISLEKQEKVCIHFIAHHTSTASQAPALCIDESKFVALEKKRSFFNRFKRRKNLIVSPESN